MIERDGSERAMETSLTVKKRERAQERRGLWNVVIIHGGRTTRKDID